MQPQVLSVNIGRSRDLSEIGETTAIDKRPVAGPVQVGELGIRGDEVGDTRDHGGIYQAVYAFAREDLDSVVVEHRPDHDVTVSTMFRALTTQRALLARLAALDLDIDPEVQERVWKYLDRTA